MFARLQSTDRAISLLVLGGILMLSIACAARTPIRAPEYTPAVTPLPPVEILPYRLQPGDTISVVFWGNSGLDQELAIRPDGRISMPFVDEVQAAGRTPLELDEELTQRYTGELAEPEITVIVRDVPSNRVFVGGEVDEQGAYPLIGHVTLVQAIQEAGGFLTTARRKEVLVVRTEPTGERVAYQINVLPVLSGENPAADLRLQPFDIVFVPRTKITNVGLFVDQYINNVIPDFIRFQLNVFDESLITSGSSTE